MNMNGLNQLNDRMKMIIEKKQFIEELAVSFFCIFTPLGKYRKLKMLKLINLEIEELKEEIEIIRNERFSILLTNHENVRFDE